MGFTNLWPLFLLITIPLLVLLYILKRKYREEVIPSTLLWNEVYKNTRANTPYNATTTNNYIIITYIKFNETIFKFWRKNLQKYNFSNR